MSVLFPSELLRRPSQHQIVERPDARELLRVKMNPARTGDLAVEEGKTKIFQARRERLYGFAQESAERVGSSFATATASWTVRAWVLEHAEDHLEQQRVLRREIIIERRLRELDLLGDRVQRRRGDAVAQQHRARRIQNFLARAFAPPLAALAPLGDIRAPIGEGTGRSSGGGAC